MIILDLDRADEETKNALVKASPVPGLRAVKYRNSIHKMGAWDVLYPAHKHNLDVFADIKIAEVEGSVETLVRMYAELERCAPKLLSVSGEVSEASLKTALRVRGTMDIVYVPMLSDQGEEDIFNTYGQTVKDFLYHRLHKAKRAGIECITCPAWLLPLISHGLQRGFWPFRTVIATGTRSGGTPAHEHKNSCTLEFAFEHGATDAVLGREATDAPEPIQTLRAMIAKVYAPASTYSSNPEPSKTGLTVDKTA